MTTILTVLQSLRTFLLPPPHEGEDSGFRSELRSAAQAGLQVAGTLSILLPAVFVATQTLVEEGGIVRWSLESLPLESTAVFLPDKVLTVLVGIVAILSGRLGLSLTKARWVGGTLAIVAGGASLFSDLLRGAVSSGYLTIILFTMTALVPFRPAQVFSLGVALVGLLCTITVGPISLLGFSGAGATLRNGDIIQLGVVTVLTTCVAAVLYRSRYRQYRQRRTAERLRNELAEEKEKSEEQAKRLAELDRAKSRFFAHVSHEFRTPLSLVLTPLRNALQNSGDESVSLSRKQALRMERNAGRLQRLIDQLLDLATLESGRMSLDRAPTDAGALIEKTVDVFAPWAERKQISLSLDRPSGGATAWLDPDKFETVARNLISNALKYTPEQGQVTVRLSRHDDREEPALQLSVSDTGPGLDSETQSEIFDLFERPSTGPAHETSGLGIGLALTRELVSLHEGDIEVESAPGEGSTFVVWFPLAPNREAGVEGTSSEGTAPEKKPTQRKTRDEREARAGESDQNGLPAAWRRDSFKEEDLMEENPQEDGPAGDDAITLLVVEDNSDMRAYLRRELAGEGQVLTAADGESAWKVVQEKRPDLVLSDVMMPGISGFELCKRIKSDPELRITPVLLLTARARSDSAVEGFESGADDYVSKPFDLAELRRRIRNHCAARDHLQEHYQEEVRLDGISASVPESQAPFAKRAVEAIDEHLSNPDFTAEALASELALSQRQLTRRMKEALGDTPAAFLRSYRIERAKARLRAGAETVAEVAYAVGFRSPSHFSQAFKGEVGRSPSAYADAAEED